MCVVIPNIESVAEIGMAGQRSLPYCNPEINSVCVASAKLNKEPYIAAKRSNPSLLAGVARNNKAAVDAKHHASL